MFNAPTPPPPHPLLGLSWKTKINRTNKLSMGPFIIRPAKLIFTMTLTLEFCPGVNPIKPVLASITSKRTQKTKFYLKLHKF